MGTPRVIGEVKSVEDAQKLSFQARADEDASDIGIGGIGGLGGMLTYLFRAGELVSPWWSTQRDMDLRRFVKSSDHLSGAVALLTSKVANVPVHVEPRDYSLKTHAKQADEYTRRLMEESEFGLGWMTLISKILDDWFCTDNGLFMEVIGGGDVSGPIQGPAVGLAALDSTRVIRKRDPEYPIAYIDDDGSQYKLHRTRVAYASDQPSNISEMLGVGFCLHRDSTVMMEDGHHERVADIVRDFSGVAVRSVAEDGALVHTKIVGWHKSPRLDRRLINIRGEKAALCQGGKERNSWITEDHKVLTPSGWKAAGELVSGDKIVTILPSPNDRQTEFLVGALMGDGSMPPSRNNGRPIFSLGHCKAQEEWFDIKASVLEHDFGFNKREYDYHLEYNGKEKVYPGIAGTTKAQAGFIELSTAFYPEGRKVFPESLIRLRWGSLLLATWYLDDGYICNREPGEKNRRPSARLSTASRSEEEIGFLCDLLTESGYDASPISAREESGKHDISISVDGSEKFFRDIAAYVPPSMRYKVPADAQKFDPSLWDLGSADRLIDRVIVKEWDKDEAQPEHVYCIDVEDTHNFATAGIVVHNCSVSRTINVAQNLVDMSIYKQEKLGSRPLRGILFTPGIPTDVVQNTLEMAAEMMDNKSMRRFAQLPILGGNDKDADIRLISLSDLPDGFDEETSTRLGMFAMALAFGVPIRWIWPAATSGATKADAMYQHIAGLGGGIGRVLKVLTLLLGGDPRGKKHTVGKFLPPHLKMEFDFQDDEQDRMKAEIEEKRMNTMAVALETGVVTLRVAREKALEAGDLTEAQFDTMELADGRLSSGEDVLTLFYAGDDSMQEMLELDVEDPLDVERNDRVEMVEAIEDKMAEVRKGMSDATSAGRKKAAKQALAALGKLMDAYKELESAQEQAVEAETEEQGQGEDQPGGEDGERTQLPRGRGREASVAEEEETEEGEVGGEEEEEEEKGLRGLWRRLIRDPKTGEGFKVWSSMDAVPKHLRTMRGARLTLAQVNHLARMGDAIERSGGTDNPWAAARAQFKKLYHIEDGQWVRSKREKGTIKKGLANLGRRAREWIKGGVGSGHHEHRGIPGKRGGSLPGLQTTGASVRLGVAGMSNTFEITAPGGARATGYFSGSDFPGEHQKEDRGELFYVDAGDRKRQGIGTSLSLDALRVMRAMGAKTVVMFPTTEAGRGLVAHLLREGYISGPIKESETKSEYGIEVGEEVKGGPGSGHHGHGGRPGHRGGSIPGGTSTSNSTDIAVHSAMLNLARRYDDFEKFSHDYSAKNYHGVYWHITESKDFAVDPTQSPRDMSSLSTTTSGDPGLMVTTDLEGWLETFPDRKYAALVELDGEPKEDYMETTRGFGHEIYVFNPGVAKVIGVFPIEEAVEVNEHLYTDVFPQSKDEARAIWEEAHGKQKGIKGGSGSGHHGHQGRPGKRGGSAPRGGIEAFPFPPGDPRNNPSFREWFGDSKIVDKDGKPIVMYHGTAAEFDVFEPERAGDVRYSDWGKGVYLTPSRWMADSYREDALEETDPEATRLWDEYNAKAKELGTTVMMAGIDLGWDSEEMKELQEYDKRWRVRLKEIEESSAGRVLSTYIKMENPLYHTGGSLPDPFLSENARSRGKDGIVILHPGGGIDEIVVFDSRQIKSVDNVMFDPENPSIYKELSEKGGPGSGHWGHLGRPGERGGSSPGRGAAWSIWGYSRAVRVAAAEGKEGPKAVIEAIREARPDINDYGANQYLDVMSLDKERFEYYAGKLGIENASGLADEYFADMKEVDRETAIKVQAVKDKATYSRWPERDHVEYVQSISAELASKATSGLVGGSVSEARNLLKDKYGTIVQNVSAEPDETIHQHVSWLLNMAEADPRIAAVLGETEKIMFIPQLIGSTAAMDVVGRTIKVHKQVFGHTPSMYVHEMGHVLENVTDAFSGFMGVGGGKGKSYSSYAFTTPSEDFAETFVALFADTPFTEYGDAPSVPEWAPDKYDFVEDQVEALL